MKLDALKKEVSSEKLPSRYVIDSLLAEGYERDRTQANVLRRADGIVNLFLKHEKHVYKNDRILGSRKGMYTDSIPAYPDAERIVGEMGSRWFGTNFDHYAPNYRHFIPLGIPGTIAEIDESLKNNRDDKAKTEFLTAARMTMTAMSEVLEQYAEEAEKVGATEAAECARFVAHNPPKTFYHALQLTFMSYILFVYEKRYAMAFGRMDQYLYPFYKADIEAGILTKEDATDLVACALYKIHETTVFFGCDDVVNIAIGGVKPEDGSDATNELSYVILHAVRDCAVPGPNLSAKIHKGTTDEFLDECLSVIGTGIGYPALMNDDVNIAAMLRYGYELEDARDYCMVGCIENLIQGKQPPWSDGRYNSPKYIEFALTNGYDMLTGNDTGVRSGEISGFDTMDKLMTAIGVQMRAGAECYMNCYNSWQAFDPVNYQSPFLSCFCDSCIERGLDINMGGAKYPSVHGVGCMGIATMADSLAAIEKLVYNDRVMTLEHLVEALRADFVGYEKEQRLMLDCPKYGNNDEFVDKYARWFIEEHFEIFDKYHTVDGGPVYIAIASNVQNISAGYEVGATADGRHARTELSDAASPMHGMDKNGPTAAFLSLCKPDYTKSGTGTVVNQKYPPSMFSDPSNRKKLGALIKVYFKKGGQEVQINSVSRDILKDAMDNPDKYRSMVVRVSGFSAYYTTLARDVQIDILKRTEHEAV